MPNDHTRRIRVHAGASAIGRHTLLRGRAAAAAAPVLAAAYLVDGGRVGAFKAHVSALNGERDDVWIACTGPWPSYSIVPEQRP